MDDEMSDDDALTNIRNGGQRGFVVLYQRYESKVYAYVSSKGIPKSDQDDVIQEIFFQLFKTLINNTFKRACLLSTWLYKITQNIVSTYWRKEKAQINLESLNQCEEIEEDNPFFYKLSEEHSEKAQNDLECQRCIERILQQLSYSNNNLYHCLKVLIWQAEGQSLIEIATLINRSEGATRKYVSECGKKLRRYSPLRDCL